MPDPITPRGPHPDADANIETERCRERALRLLEQRAHSVAELRRKLTQRGFAADVVGRILDDLRRVGLLDDRAFAELCLDSMLSSSRPMGQRRLTAKLHRTGLAPELIRDAVAEHRIAADPEAEAQRAVDAARRKLRSLRRPIDDRMTRMKIARHLATRGFSAEMSRHAIDSLRTNDSENRSDRED